MIIAALRPFRLFLVLSCLSVLATMGAARSEALVSSHKDRLFAYPERIAEQDGGAHRSFDYQEMRDINGRDQVPERRVKSEYVSLGVRRQQQSLTVEGVRHYAVGRTTGARFIVVYLHGQGGSLDQGIDDYTFGGNFNRIKNLAATSGGLYLSPGFPDFGANGARLVSGLIAHYASASPGAPVFVACGSMGGALCWQLAKDAKLAPRLGGLILLGSHWSDDFTASPAFKAKVPVLLAHGSRDKVFPVDRQEAFYRTVRAAAPGYPIRFVRFESGTHGTPIRMVDWRETLNWMHESGR